MFARPARIALDFPPFKHDTGLELFFDEIVVESFLVGDDAHVCVSGGIRGEDARIPHSTGFKKDPAGHASGLKNPY